MDNVRQFSIPVGIYVTQILGALPFMEDYKPGNKIAWDTRFMYDYARAKIQDAFIIALNSGIPGLDSPLAAPSLKEKAFEPFIDHFAERWYESFIEPVFPEFVPPAGETNPRRIDQARTDYKYECMRKRSKAREEHGKRTKGILKDILADIDRNLEGVFQDVENSVYEKIGRPTTDLWTTSVDDSGDIVARLAGDFRILEWEQEHLDEDGKYVSVADKVERIFADMDTTLADIAEGALKEVNRLKAISHLPFAGQTLAVIGFNDLGTDDNPRFDFNKEEVKTMVENLGGRVMTGFSTTHHGLVISSEDDLTAKEIITLQLFKAANKPIFTADSFKAYFDQKAVKVKR